MRVIVTRPTSQAGKWLKALRAAGFEALSLPLIEITGAPDPQAVQAVWQRVPRFDALMFVSANAVEHFFALQPAGPAVLHASPRVKTRCFATGAGTVAALLRAGVPPDRIDAPDHAAAQFDSEALWAVVRTQVQPGWQVLIVRGDSEGGKGAAGKGEEADASPGEEADASQGAGRDWLAARLAEQGAFVEFLVSYARRAPQPEAHALSLLQAASADGSIWMFSSSEAVGNLRSMAPGLSWGQARAVATHPRIAEAARAAGFAVVLESRPAMTDLIASIESLA